MMDEFNTENKGEPLFAGMEVESVYNQLLDLYKDAVNDTITVEIGMQHTICYNYTCVRVAMYVPLSKFLCCPDTYENNFDLCKKPFQFRHYYKMDEIAIPVNEVGKNKIKLFAPWGIYKHAEYSLHSDRDDIMKMIAEGYSMCKKDNLMRD